MQLDQVEMSRPPHNMRELPLVENRLNASTTATHYVIYAQIYLIMLHGMQRNKDLFYFEHKEFIIRLIKDRFKFF